MLDALPEVVRDLAFSDSALDKMWDNGTVRDMKIKYDGLIKEKEQYARVKGKL